MAAFVAQSVTFTTASGTKTVTITPNVGELIVVVVANSGQTATPTLTDDNTDGLGTYTEVSGGVLTNTSADKMFVFVRNALVGNSVSTIITMTPGATTGGGLEVTRISGMSRAGASAVLQTAKQENQASGGTPAPAFASAALTGNMTLGAIMNATNPATMTPPVGWTPERSDVGYATPATGLEIVTRDSGFTGTTITWGGTSPSAFGSVIVELDNSAAAAGAIPITRNDRNWLDLLSQFDTAGWS